MRRMVGVYGPESLRRTTLIYHVLGAERQELGEGGLRVIDAGTRWTRSYARKIGARHRRAVVSEPDYGEQALENRRHARASGAVDVVAIDWVATLTPRVELEGQMGDDDPSRAQARMMSEAMRKLAETSTARRRSAYLDQPDPRKVGVMFGLLVDPSLAVARAEVLRLERWDIRASRR